MDRVGDLTLFLRVLDLGSITAAAHSLDLSVAVASQRLKNLRSHCESVPRIYSGVVYDFCSLNGEPNSKKSLDEQQIGPLPWIAVDLVLSGVLDTLVLPYTVYRQNLDGSIEIFR